MEEGTRRRLDGLLSGQQLMLQVPLVASISSVTPETSLTPVSGLWSSGSLALARF